MRRRVARKIAKRINAGAACPRMNGRGYPEGTRLRAVAKLYPGTGTGNVVRLLRSLHHGDTTPPDSMSCIELFHRKLMDGLRHLQLPREYLYPPAVKTLADEAVAVLDKHMRDVGILPSVEVLESGIDRCAVVIKNVPPEWFVGLSAGEMRRRGIGPIPANVPDCATLKHQKDGRVAFEWVELDFILTPTGPELSPP